VRVVDEDRDLDGLDDELLLLLASNEGRILITANAKDFLRIIGRWAKAGRVHAGCVLLPYTFRQDQFDAIIAGVEALLAEAPLQQDWIDRTEWLSRGTRN
jgi:hypothetical protein